MYFSSELFSAAITILSAFAVEDDVVVGVEVVEVVVVVVVVDVTVFGCDIFRAL
jgi:hypothetical protein